MKLVQALALALPCRALLFEYAWELQGPAASVVGGNATADGFVPLTLPGLSADASAPWLECARGEVMLPVHRAAFALAPGAAAGAARVVELRDATYETVALPPAAAAPLPSPGRVTRCGGDDAPAFALAPGGGVAAAARGADGFARHGAPAAGLSDVETLRDVAFQVLTIAPVEYDPSSRRVRVLTRATVVLDGVATAADDAPPLRAVDEFAEVYAAVFENAAALRVAPSGPGAALIVHAPALADEAARLAAHKLRAQGVAATVVDAADVPRAGDDAPLAADDLAAFVAAAYAGDEAIKDLASVVLLGDYAALPVPIGNHSEAACDSCLGFITRDHSVDLMVSRLVDTAAAAAGRPDAVAAQIAKLEHYEARGASAAGARAFSTRAYGVASRQSGSFPPETDCARSRAWGETLLDWKFASRRNECDPYATTAPGLAELEAAFDAGRAGSLVTYLGHGGGTFWVMTGFDVGAAHNLTNTFGQNAVVLDGSCNCGDFAHTTIRGMDECLAEAMMAGNPDVAGSGAVAMWSSAPEALWVPPADMTTGSIAALTGGYVTRLGPLVFAGAAYMRTQWPGDDGKYTIEGYNLFGDSMMGLDALPL